MKCVVCGRSVQEIEFRSPSGTLLHVGYECPPCSVIAVAEPGSKEEGGLMVHAATRYRRKYGVE